MCRLQGIHSRSMCKDLMLCACQSFAIEKILLSVGCGTFGQLASFASVTLLGIQYIHICDTVTVYQVSDKCWEFLSAVSPGNVSKYFVAVSSIYREHKKLTETPDCMKHCHWA